MKGVPALVLTRPGSADLYSSFGSESGFNLTSINNKLQPKAPHQNSRFDHLCYVRISHAINSPTLPTTTAAFDDDLRLPACNALASQPCSLVS
jgi:hypothetical protein